VLYYLSVNLLFISNMKESFVNVNFISSPSPEKPVSKKVEPPPKPLKREPPQLLAVHKEVAAPNDYVAPVQKEDISEIVNQAPQMKLPVGPVDLGSELSVSCPDRSAPVYPRRSINRGETGKVVLRVELSETGLVTMASIQNSSGFGLLDESALAAVRTWRCNAAKRNGQPVKAVALQPFNFILQGN
jgi:periplasmic protein TonB